MTKPDFEETPPTFVERLNNIACYSYLALNIFSATAWVVLLNKERFVTPDQKIGIIKLILCLQISCPLIYTVLSIALYIILGKWLNPLQENLVPITASNFILGGLILLFNISTLTRI